ncbi:dihydroxy-acid dehydratase/L-arabonate dehydrase [Granulicella pectinivorans]|uniref:Dihydroxy-acid dehydratase/L-arabonate dehydrase n=1 Tax=Granulicella pectinivorans TaxID=474950 RepID=A0A1I6MXY8_9BACT|nr:L-arabinonate dehydratase [Granulicella pectinivorans]SFS20418.1 dihydroxy-acid dehydratase/L-arabonate dehydrase [Granulicella pectinivorans]
MTQEKRQFRSAAWFGRSDKDGFIHRSWMKNQGFPPDVFDGRPVIGICNTWSELTPCNAHLRALAERVKRGIWEMGGLPLEFPVMSTGETNLRPTAMLYRNLVSMDVEESLRANPVDGVVLMCGCDKTTPALLMGAASCDLPAIVVSGGPMLNGKFHGKDIGSGTDLWRFSEDVKAGKMSQQEFAEAESCMSRSAGHCMTMGTASTMAGMAEALGMTLPHNAAIPAVDSRRSVLAHLSGRRIVEMVHENLTPSQILKRAAFENAIRINGALGGSTNAVIHLLAIAGRVGVPLTLDDWDRIGRDTPTLVDLMPSGRFLMEDFYYAGGLPAVVRSLAEHQLLHADALTVTGKPIIENCKDAPNWNQEVIRTFDNPLVKQGGVAVLRGNLAPDGAVLKPSAASAELMQHRGPAVVFSSVEHYHERIMDPQLEVDENSVLVLQNCGPKGYPGMPEVGNMGLPPKLLARGIKDMVRISDARMSGTAYGTVILHVCPEAALGGPLALVRDGDMIEVDVKKRRLHLDVSDDELARRREEWVSPLPAMQGGYQQMYIQHVMQACEGADLDFLVGCRGNKVPRESH